jgi:phosphatidylserine/phosphatidylglycerophosphate/cardiolipin synthase-like enzyme
MTTPDARSIPLYPADAAALLWGAEIFDATLVAIERATERAWACYFIVSMQQAVDRRGRVKELLDALVRARLRGVDVRLIVDAFDTSEVDDLDVNLVAVHYLAQQGVEARVYQGDRRATTHSKYLLIDDSIAIVGSGNWSPGGLGGNLEAAVRVESADFVDALGDRFAENWALAQIPEPLT